MVFHIFNIGVTLANKARRIFFKNPDFSKWNFHIISQWFFVDCFLLFRMLRIITFYLNDNQRTLSLCIHLVRVLWWDWPSPTIMGFCLAKLFWGNKSVKEFDNKVCWLLNLTQFMFHCFIYTLQSLEKWGHGPDII